MQWEELFHNKKDTMQEYLCLLYLVKYLSSQELCLQLLSVLWLGSILGIFTSICWVHVHDTKPIQLRGHLSKYLNFTAGVSHKKTLQVSGQGGQQMCGFCLLLHLLLLAALITFFAKSPRGRNL